MMNSAYTVQLPIFEGPLDLLLDLIEQRKLLINDVSLAKVTDDYLAHIKENGSFSLPGAAHFILVASTLLLIKSRSLLPSLALTEEEQGSIEDLERRLMLYKKMKDLSVGVKELFGKEVIFFREPSQDIEPIFAPTKELHQGGVLAAIQQVLRTLPKKELIPQLIVRKVMSLEEMIETLMGRMAHALNMSFKEFSENAKGDVSQVIIGFLAMIELVKRGIISVKQDNHFEDIEISKKLESL